MGDSSRFWGAVLCLVIGAVAVVFLWGIFAQCYWALAIPVTIGVSGNPGSRLLDRLDHFDHQDHSSGPRTKAG